MHTLPGVALPQNQDMRSGSSRSARMSKLCMRLAGLRNKS